MEINIEGQHLEGGLGESAEIWQTETITAYLDEFSDVEVFSFLFHLEGMTLTTYSLVVEPTNAGSIFLDITQEGEISSDYEVDRVS